MFCWAISAAEKIKKGYDPKLLNVDSKSMVKLLSHKLQIVEQVGMLD